jgi:hypothetical protein
LAFKKQRNIIMQVLLGFFQRKNIIFVPYRCYVYALFSIE